MAENPLDPSADTEDRIRVRAYHLWEADGSPHGREGEYWERARELQAIADNPTAGALPNPMTEPQRSAAEQPIEEAALQENLGEFPHGGLRDQGDRAEMPMVRGKAKSVPKMGEQQVQDSPAAPQSPKKAAKKK